MSVIVAFQVAAAEFELGRILDVDDGATVELERLVPTGRTAVPLFWVHNATPGAFVKRLLDRSGVDDASLVDVFEDRSLFTLDWDPSQDRLFRAVVEHDGQLLGATGTASTWQFEVRFPTRDALSAFSTTCEDAGLSLEIGRVYQPSDERMDPHLGVTKPQYDAIRLALAKGYFDTPRRCTTKELGDELGISDQAVMEWLRRGISTVLGNSLSTVEQPE